MKNEGYIPGDKALESAQELSASEKITDSDLNAVHRLFGLNKEENKKGKIGMAAKEKEAGKSRYTGSPKQAINTLFQNM